MLVDMSVLDWLSQVTQWFAQFGHQPPGARTIFFMMWVVLGALVCFGSPYFTIQEKSVSTKAAPAPHAPSPAPTQKVEVQTRGKSSPIRNVASTQIGPDNPAVKNVNTSPVELKNAAAENLIAAPIQIDSSSYGSVEAIVGNNVQAPKEVAAGIFIHAAPGATVNFSIAEGVSIQKNTIKVETKDGGATQIEIYTLFDSAAWAYKSSSQLKSIKDKDVTLEEFLDSAEFLGEIKDYHAVVCLGLASGFAQGELRRTVTLSDERAVHLCGLVSRKIYLGFPKVQVFGLPLGYNKNSSPGLNSKEEKAQRSVVILGIKANSGSLENEIELKRVVSEILRNDGFANFRSSDYSEVTSGKPLRYMRIERGVYSTK